MDVMINIILVIILKNLLTKDPDQSENVEEDSKIMDAMYADQLDCGEGKESHHLSYGKEDGLIKVKFDYS